jgi:hydroxymethylglutaryl-CoA reductase (NADPH)
MRLSEPDRVASVPMRLVGPLKIIGETFTEPVLIPLATFETPLWATTHRGARLCSQAGGVQVMVIDDRMTRSVLLEADSAAILHPIYLAIRESQAELATVVTRASRFAKLLDLHAQLVGNLLYLRFAFSTGDAAGHNMTTLAADRLLEWILARYPRLRYVSISSNFCTDKKASAVNGILGRGKYVIAEVTVPGALCRRLLRVTPQEIVDLNIKKNLLGNIISGGVRTANAHFANMLLGFYLATGQDGANLVEGSQGMVFAECRGDDLYFSVTVPNVIVGTVGNGKTLDFVRENLKLLGCLEGRATGVNAKRLAMIAAGAVLCGELSLLAAQTNQGELTRAHLKLERLQREKPP